MSSGAAIGARGVGLLTVLVSIPLAVRYLGAERYGLWMTITSALAVLLFADLGLGNGLLNAIGEAHGRDDRESARIAVSSAFAMLCTLSIILAFAFAVLYPHVPWNDVYNVSSAKATAEAGPATAVFVACFLIGLPLAVVERTQLGYQEGFISGLWLAVGSVFGLVGLIVAIQLQASLPWLVLCVSGGPVLASLINGVLLFGRWRPWLRPRLKAVSRATSRRLVKLGLMFFVLQVAVVFAFQSDNVVAAQILGPEAVTTYALAFKLFTLTPLLLALALTPLWPAYGEAASRGDVAWIKTTLLWSTALVFAITAVVSSVLVAIGGPVLRLWAGGAVDSSFALFAGLGIWAVVSVCGNSIAMFLNGANVLRFQVICAVFMAAGALMGKIAFADLFGLAGIAWATVCAYVVLTAIPTVIYLPRVLARLESARGPRENAVSF